MTKLTQKQQELLNEIKENGNVTTGKFGKHSVRTLHALFIKGLIAIKGNWLEYRDEYQHSWDCCLAENASGDYVVDEQLIIIEIGYGVIYSDDNIKKLIFGSGFSGRIIVREAWDIDGLAQANIRIGNVWKTYEVPQSVMCVLVANS